MQLIRKLEDIPESLRGGAVTIGNFDGVHKGHARIIGRLKQFAAKFHGAVIVFTFDPHPVRLLRPENAPAPLTWINRKADLLAAIGVDAVVAYPTDLKLLELPYDRFFCKVFLEHLGGKAIVEGPNFYFGKNRQGDTSKLAQLCQQHQVELEIVTPEKVDGEYISSSRIRKLISEGSVRAASQMLTCPYRIRGMVTHGAARGTSIGFPTANLDAIDTLIPAFGVYAGRTYVDGRSHWSAIHIGPNPTFGEDYPKVESHLLDFENSIYGKPVEIDFVQRLRGIEQFDSPDLLVAQLNLDVEQTRQIARSF